MSTTHSRSPSSQPLSEVLGAFASVTSVIGFSGAAAALWVRYRRGDPIERQQLKWLLAVAALAAVLFPIAFIVPVQAIGNAAFILGSLTLIALPLAIAVAILRYRLFEIDRIVSRTLSYAIVTGLLGAVFVGVILLLQTAFTDALGGGGIPVAISTLACSRSSSPSCAASAGRSIGASTEPAMTESERRARSPSGCAGRPTWRASPATSERPSRAPSRRRLSRSGSAEAVSDASGLAWQPRSRSTDMILFAAAVIVGPNPDYGRDALYLLGIGAYVGIGVAPCPPGPCEPHRRGDGCRRGPSRWPPPCSAPMPISA